LQFGPGSHPVPVCHEWNTVAHLNDYEGRPGRRPFTYDELQVLFDYLDERVERVAGSGRKGALAALRDAQMIKTAYAFGLRRNELCRLDVADLRPNPAVREWGTYGSVHVRYGKAIRGGVPRRRTVLAVPEFDWAIAGLRQWVEQARPILNAGDHPALWVSERLSRVSTVHLGKRFAWLRDEAGLDPALQEFFQLRIRSGFAQFDLHLRVMAAEVAQKGRQHVVIGGRDKGQRQPPGCAAGGASYQFGQGFGLQQDAPRLQQQRRPGRRERHAAPGARKQCRTEAGFQRHDGLRQRRLRHVQARCSATEVHFLGHGDEVT